MLTSLYESDDLKGLKERNSKEKMERQNLEKDKPKWRIILFQPNKIKRLKDDVDNMTRIELFQSSLGFLILTMICAGIFIAAIVLLNRIPEEVNHISEVYIFFFAFLSTMGGGLIAVSCFTYSTHLAILGIFRSNNFIPQKNYNGTSAYTNKTTLGEGYVDS